MRVDGSWRLPIEGVASGSRPRRDGLGHCPVVSLRCLSPRAVVRPTTHGRNHGDSGDHVHQKLCLSTVHVRDDAPNRGFLCTERRFRGTSVHRIRPRNGSQCTPRHVLRALSAHAPVIWGRACTQVPFRPSPSAHERFDPGIRVSAAPSVGLSPCALELCRTAPRTESSRFRGRDLAHRTLRRRFGRPNVPSAPSRCS